MKQFLLLFTLLWLTGLYGKSQVVLLNMSNPFPRIGDVCEISYEIKADTLESGSSKSLLEQIKEQQMKALGEGTLKLTKLIKDTGMNRLGPFVFEVNGRLIRSEQLTIHFDAPLPDDTKGIWIRQRQYKGEEYLVMEQRISGDWVTKKTAENSSSTEFISDSDDFAEIDLDKTDPGKIKFEFSFSHNRSQEVEINNRSVTVSYKISLYRIKKAAGFNNAYQLNSRNLKNLPPGQQGFVFTIK